MRDMSPHCHETARPFPLIDIPPPGTVAITNERARARLAIFWAQTRMGWRETSG
jgi:hypothetical protein